MLMHLGKEMRTMHNFDGKKLNCNSRLPVTIMVMIIIKL